MLKGFRNEFQSEVEAGCLPQTLQPSDFKLYPEQISGSAFTVPRHRQLRTWVYRTFPSVCHDGYRELTSSHFKTWKILDEMQINPNPFRWKPISNSNSFFESVFTLGGNELGSFHLYDANQSSDFYFENGDAETLLIPISGKLQVKTELGSFELKKGFLGCIPKGIRFFVEVLEPSKGYFFENFSSPFILPDLGPIGSNGLAHPWDFESPVAFFERKNKECVLKIKTQGKFFETNLPDSPLNVKAFRGNYLPYRYEFSKFQTIGTVSFDHPDPSIFTVLTSPSAFAGTANFDFVIFPPRWMVAENTFRPPYFHRNVMSEWMGLVEGHYDAKADGFVPGGSSLHNSGIPHGPDQITTESMNKSLGPIKQDHTLAFMFESRLPYKVHPQALNSTFLDQNYIQCWKGFKQFE